MRSVYLMLLALIIQLSAFGQGSFNINLVYQWNDMSLPSTTAHNNRYNEIWGLAQGGREYAVIGSTMGTHIFDITNPFNVDTPIFIPGAAFGVKIIHRDYHDYNGYLYIVCDEDSGLYFSTLQIVDISLLPDSVTVVYDSNALIKTSHNIFIDTSTAKMYASGVRHYDSTYQRMEVFSLANPIDPILIDTYDRGRHDVYVRNDTAYLNDGASGLYVVDFQTQGSPVEVGTLPADSGYNHSGWLNAAGNIYAMAYESFGYPINIMDVSDLSNISVLSTISSGVVDSLSIPHNLIIRDEFLYASYYSDGIYIMDISDPVNPVITGYYDTSAETHKKGKFRGAWGVYPLLPSGLVLVSDMQNGLYVLDPIAAIHPNPIVDPIAAIHPNPFTDFLVVSDLPEGNKVDYVEIFNEMGQKISSSAVSSIGGEIRIDTRHLPVGNYEVSLQGSGFTAVYKMIKIK